MQTQTDLFSWCAYYGNVEALREEQASQGFASVDQGRITHIGLLLGEKAEHIVSVPAGAQVVFFRRRSVEFSLTGENNQQLATIHCIGWKKSEQAVYLFVFENGRTLLTDDLQAV